nr:hypothetical protein [Tanacetum cinerariifolium]
MEVVENLQGLEDDGQPYENIEEVWPDYPTKEDFMAYDAIAEHTYLASCPLPSAAHSDLWARLLAFDLDGAAQFSFSQRLARDNGWSKAFAQRVALEYKNGTTLWRSSALSAPQPAALLASATPTLALGTRPPGGIRVGCKVEGQLNLLQGFRSEIKRAGVTPPSVPYEATVWYLLRDNVRADLSTIRQKAMHENLSAVQALDDALISQGLLLPPAVRRRLDNIPLLTIVGLWVFGLIKGEHHEVYKNATPGPIPVAFRTLQVKFKPEKYLTIGAVVTMNAAKVPGDNQIDAIGVANVDVQIVKQDFKNAASEVETVQMDSTLKTL